MKKFFYFLLVFINIVAGIIVGIIAYDVVSLLFVAHKATPLTIFFIKNYHILFFFPLIFLFGYLSKEKIKREMADLFA